MGAKDLIEQVANGVDPIDIVNEATISSGGMKWSQSGISSLEKALKEAGVGLKYEANRIAYSLDGERWFEANHLPSSISSKAKRAINAHYKFFTKMFTI